jgi:cyclophilin family peptidyl-prolyl cis-trans isomerase
MRVRLCFVLPLILASFALAQTPAAPAKKLDPGLYAMFTTSMGTITTELYEKEAPNTVRNFVGLARGTRPWLDPKTRQMVTRPLYDNITFHRVIPDFMIQSGDPTGVGNHNCGFMLKDEIVTGFRFDRPGRLAMANIGRPNSGACQFFVTDGPYPAGNGMYTIFGQVVDGQNVVAKIARVIRDGNDKPRFPVKLMHVDIMRVVAAPEYHLTRTGAAVIVNASGDLLTSYQAAQGCAEIRLRDGSKVPGAVYDQQNGLALLRMGKKADGFVSFRSGEPLGAGDAAWLVSYAAPGGSSSVLSLTGSTVSAAADSHGDNRFLQIALPAQAAPPGTPVLDQSGKLAGILAGSPEDAAPTGLAVKSTAAMGFLDSASVSYTAAAAGAVVDQAAMAENARQYTVEIQCWK